MYPFMAVALALSIGTAWKLYGDKVRAVLFALCLVGGSAAGYACILNVYHLNSYYSIQYGLAQEEFMITEEINARSTNPLIYTYKNDNLGSIQYYTQLPFTEHKFVYRLEEALHTAPGFVVTPVTLSELENQFPELSFEPIYTGTLLSLFAVAS